VFRVVQRRTMSHTDMGIVGATMDSFILFENGARRNRLVLPGLSNAADHASAFARRVTADKSLIRPSVLFGVIARGITDNAGGRARELASVDCCRYVI
jgi:hypothetical protein